MTTKEGIKIALKHIGLSGFSGISVSAPSAIQAFHILFVSTIKDDFRRVRVYHELRRQELVHFSSPQNEQLLTITPNGAHRLLSITADGIKIKPMKHWDMRWRLVCFDIPKGKNKERQYFNKRLKELGFTMVQKSMWVHPFECAKEIDTITDHVNIKSYITMLEVVKMDERTTKRLLRHYDHILNT